MGWTTLPSVYRDNERTQPHSTELNRPVGHGLKQSVEPKYYWPRHHALHSRLKAHHHDIAAALIVGAMQNSTHIVHSGA